MKQPLLIIHCGAPSERLASLRAFAEFVGIDAHVANIAADEFTTDPNGFEAAIIDVTSLARTTFARAIDRLEQALSSQSALLLVTDHSPASQQLLHRLSRGCLRGVTEIARANTIEFVSAASAELEGQSYSRDASAALSLDVADATGCVTLMKVAGSPALVSLSHDHRTFAWSTRNVYNLARLVARELEVEQSLGDILPAIIFLRAAFGDRCWNNPNRTAGLIIDDPLLKPKYGCIDFKRLLEPARTESFRVTLAFIPWNGWRTRVADTELFVQYSDSFDLCIHGCDHVDNEFGIEDHALLLRKTGIAVARMDRLSARTGLKYAPVMVCPQEQCSMAAWRAFSENRDVLAMTNTSCIPRNAAASTVLASDLLLPAHDALYGFPIFKRHYSGQNGAFALALYLGRPAIMVEHHEYFRGGRHGVCEFARDLRRMNSSVSWKSLEDIVTTTHLQRRASAKHTEVRFFTRRFTFHPSGEPEMRYTLFKRVPNPSSVKSVFIDRIPTPFSIESNRVIFELAVTDARRHQIEVEIDTPEPKPVRTFSPFYQSRVALRRLLSEIRDEHLSRFAVTARVSHVVARSLSTRSATATGS